MPPTGGALTAERRRTHLRYSDALYRRVAVGAGSRQRVRPGELGVPAHRAGRQRCHAATTGWRGRGEVADVIAEAAAATRGGGSRAKAEEDSWSEGIWVGTLRRSGRQRADGVSPVGVQAAAPL